MQVVGMFSAHISHWQLACSCLRIWRSGNVEAVKCKFAKGYPSRPPPFSIQNSSWSTCMAPATAGAMVTGPRPALRAYAGFGPKLRQGFELKAHGSGAFLRCLRKGEESSAIPKREIYLHVPDHPGSHPSGASCRPKTVIQSPRD